MGDNRAHDISGPELEKVLATTLHRERGIKEIQKGVFRVQVFQGRDALTGNPIQPERIARGGIRKAREVRAQLESETKY